MIFHSVKEGFSEDHVERAMGAARDLAISEELDQRETGFSFFTNLAGVMKENMGSMMDDLVPLLIEHMSTCDKKLLNDGMSQENLTSHILNTLKDEDPDEDEDEDVLINFSTVVIDSKKAAIACLASLSNNCPESFFPHLKDALQIIMTETDSGHMGIRSDAISCLPHLFSSANHSFPIPHDFSVELLDGILKLLEFHIVEDLDKPAAAKSCIALVVSVKTYPLRLNLGGLNNVYVLI